MPIILAIEILIAASVPIFLHAHFFNLSILQGRFVFFYSSLVSSLVFVLISYLFNVHLEIFLIHWNNSHVQLPSLFLNLFLVKFYKWKKSLAFVLVVLFSCESANSLSHFLQILSPILVIFNVQHHRDNLTENTIVSIFLFFVVLAILCYVGKLFFDVI